MRSYPLGEMPRFLRESLAGAIKFSQHAVAFLNLYPANSEQCVIRKSMHNNEQIYSKTCAKWPLSKRQKIVFQDQLSLNGGQKYCRMLICSSFDLY